MQRDIALIRNRFFLGENGMLLHSSGAGGKVVFSLEELPYQVPFLTENNNTIIRLSQEEVELQPAIGEPILIKIDIDPRHLGKNTEEEHKPKKIEDVKREYEAAKKKGETPYAPPPTALPVKHQSDRSKKIEEIRQKEREFVAKKKAERDAQSAKYKEAREKARMEEKLKQLNERDRTGITMADKLRAKSYLK